MRCALEGDAQLFRCTSPSLFSSSTIIRAFFLSQDSVPSGTEKDSRRDSTSQVSALEREVQVSVPCSPTNSYSAPGAGAGACRPDRITWHIRPNTAKVMPNEHCERCPTERATANNFAAKQQLPAQSATVIAQSATVIAQSSNGVSRIRRCRHNPAVLQYFPDMISIIYHIMEDTAPVAPGMYFVLGSELHLDKKAILSILHHVFFRR